MKTIVGMFDTFPHAQNAADALDTMGIARSNISVVANNETGHYDQYATAETTGDASLDTAHAAGTGATAGTVVGGVTGLLMGLGLFVIPGFGPIAAAGWLVSTLTGAGIGAVAGSLVGGLTHAGVPHEDAVVFNEGVRRGATLLAVKAEDDQADQVAKILGEQGAVDINERGGQYRQEGVTPAPANGVQTTSAAQTIRPMNSEMEQPGAQHVRGGETMETQPGESTTERAVERKSV